MAGTEASLGTRDERHKRSSLRKALSGVAAWFSEADVQGRVRKEAGKEEAGVGGVDAQRRGSPLRRGRVGVALAGRKTGWQRGRGGVRRR